MNKKDLEKGAPQELTADEMVHLIKKGKGKYVLFCCRELPALNHYEKISASLKLWVEYYDSSASQDG